MKPQKKHLKRSPDYFFLLIIILLTMIGFIMVFSTTATMGLRLGDPFFYVKRDILYIIAGIAAMIFGFGLDYRKLQKYSFGLFILSVIFLFLVFIPKIGISSGGASRW